MCCLSKSRLQCVCGLLVLCMVFGVLPLSAQTVKAYLPTLGGMDQELGLALLNPTFMDATVTLTLRGYDGSLIQGTGIVNPVLFPLRNRRQCSRKKYSVRPSPVKAAGSN